MGRVAYFLINEKSFSILNAPLIHSLNHSFTSCNVATQLLIQSRRGQSLIREMSFPFKQVRSLSRGLQWQCGTRSAATLLPHYLKHRHHYYHHHHHHHTCGQRVSERGFTTATAAATGPVTRSDTATESALAKLVHALELRDLDAFVVPTADPHLGEPLLTLHFTV
jgi:hypothetical protein